MFLVRIADFRVGQIKNWFQHQRRKLQKGCSLTEDEMLLAQEENNGSGQQTEDQEEDEILLSQATDNTPSLTSRSSIVSSVLLTKEKDVALKRPLPGEESILLDKSPACELGEAAIQILMSGYIGRGFRGLGGIHVEKSPSNLSLASIAPSTFCPGFKEVCIALVFTLCTDGEFLAVDGTQHSFSPNNNPCYLCLLAWKYPIPKSERETQ